MLVMTVAPKDLILWILLVVASLENAFGQRCPVYWHGSSDTSKCYRLRYMNKMTWQNARDYCRVFGGDLVKVESSNEKNWLYQQIQMIQNRTNAGANWWVGMNNLENVNQWVWSVDNAPYNASVINWIKGAPDNAGGNERCGEIMGTAFNDEECSDKNKYVCQRARGVPLLCDADNNWQTGNGKCYKVYGQNKPWNAAVTQCSRDGGYLFEIHSPEDEMLLRDIAVNQNNQYWIGLHSIVNQASPTGYSWFWNLNGTYLDGMSLVYWHGNPIVSGANKNATCAFVTNQALDLNAWNTAPCNQNKKFVCQKPEGVCLPGWIGHRNQCFQFNLQYSLTFSDASAYCSQQGGELLRIPSETTQKFINSYLDEMQNSQINRFWIGLSDNNMTSGPFKWRNGDTMQYQHFAGNNTPKNSVGKMDCVFIQTSDTAGKWRVADNCQQNMAFVCNIPVNKPVKPVLHTPRPTYSCPTNWKLHGNICYYFNDAVQRSWLESRAACNQKGPSSDLVKITSDDIQGFINHQLQPGQVFWIGLSDRTQEGTYTWLDETVQTTYTHWHRGEPNNFHGSQNCVTTTNSDWDDDGCDHMHRYICSMPASNIPAPTVPTTIRTDWTYKCGPKWESNPNTDNCYLFVDVSLDWVDAGQFCRLQNGTLLAIESIQEQFYIAGHIKTMNSIGVWIGANDRSQEGGWQWSGGQPFAYINWAPGQPGNNNGGGTDCVVMYTQSAQWDDISCTARNGFVCEKLAIAPKGTTIRTTTPRIPAGMVLGCPYGWLPFGNDCFKVYVNSVNWMTAKTLCGRDGASLASIYNRNEHNFIISHLPKAANPLDAYWIGLNDQQIEMTFQWADGTAVTYTNWALNEPNNWRNLEDCVTIKQATGGQWNDDTCTENRKGFICRQGKSAVSATQNPDQTGCPMYTHGYGPYCYKIYADDSRSWADANSVCNSSFQGTLATINDRFTQAFISSLIWKRAGFYWIGLSDVRTPGTYYWINGNPVQFTFWYNTHTGNERRTCAAMRATAPVGLWENSACNIQQQYVCQFRRQGYTLPPSMPSTSVGQCPNNWTPYRGFCFFAFRDISQKKTWFEARDFCRSLHGDLPSLHSKQDDVFLSQTLLRAYSGTYFWLGLNDIDNEAGYIWSDRSPTDYTNWNQGEPNNANDQEDCTEYSMYTKTWNDNSCYLARYFICQIRPGITIPATTVPPTASSSILCGSDPNWLYYNDTCYRLNDVSGPNATLSWYNSEAYCNNFLSHLVSVHSRNENQFLLSLISKRSQSKYWTGFNELDLNSYKWTDLSIVNYNNWEASEPNDYFGGEKCAEMHNWNGMWNDANCNQKLGFICKKPVHGRATFIPTIYPPGGCSNGFVRLPGGQNKCYYLGGLTTDARSNWTDARDKCRGFGKYYDIASIESDFEQAFLVSLMKGYTFRFWIGLSDLSHDGQFVWLDNEPITYTNWDKGQPTNTQGQTYCVAMRTLDPVGKWANFQCATQLAYICQTKQDPSIPTINPPSGCSAGYTSMVNSQNCYKVYSNAQKTWQDAQVVCKADGGNLASMLNVNEAAFIQVLAYNLAPYWIGLSDASTSGVSTGVYSWSDGWPISYASWGRNQPDHGANEGCVVVDNAGKWNDTTCNSVYNYVCKISSVSPPMVTSPVLGQCADPTWIMNGGFCYFMDVNGKMSWPEANYRCNRIGMGLLSVHSTTENTFVMSLIQQATVQDPNYQPNIWTGLSKGPSGAFVYSDRTPVDYLNWEQGAPSGVGQKNQLEECVEVNRFSGQWNDVDCFVHLGYMCKAPIVSSTTASSLPPGSSNAGPQITYTPYIIPPTQSQINTMGSGSGGYTIRYPNGSVVNGTASQTPSVQYLNQESNKSPSLSGGGIAGIIIGVIAILLIIAIGMLLLKRRFGPGAFSRFGIRENFENLSFDNALYSKNNETVNIDKPEKRETSPKSHYLNVSPSEEGSDA